MSITLQKTSKDEKKLLKKTILEGILVGRLSLVEIVDYIRNNANSAEDLDKSYIFSLIRELEQKSFIKRITVNRHSHYFIYYPQFPKAREIYGIRKINDIIKLQEVEDHKTVVKKICNELEYYNLSTITEYPTTYTEISGKQKKGRIDIVVTKKNDKEDILFGIEYENGGNPPLQFLNNCAKIIEFKKPTIILTHPKLFGYYKMWLTSFFNGGVNRKFETNVPIYLINVNDFTAVKKIPSEEIICAKFPQNAENIEINFEVFSNDAHNSDEDTQDNPSQNIEGMQDTNEVLYSVNSQAQVQHTIQPIPSVDKQYADILQTIEKLIDNWKRGKEQDAIVFAQILQSLQSLNELNNQQMDLQTTHSVLLTNIDTKMNTSLNTQEEIKDKVTHTNSILSLWDYDLLKKYQIIILILLGIVVAYTGIIIGYYLYL